MRDFLQSSWDRHLVKHFLQGFLCGGLHTRTQDPQTHPEDMALRVRRRAGVGLGELWWRREKLWWWGRGGCGGEGGVGCGGAGVGVGWSGGGGCVEGVGWGLGWWRWEEGEWRGVGGERVP